MSGGDGDVDQGVQIAVFGNAGGLGRQRTLRVRNRLHDGARVYELETGDAGHEVPDVLIRRIGNYLLRGSNLNDAPVLHDCDPVTDTDRLVQIVSDENRGLSHHRCQLHELVLELAADQRIQGAEGLVHQEDIGIGRERAAQPHPLLHAPRELVGEAVLPTVELHQVEHALGLFPALSLAETAYFQGLGDVVAHRPMRHQAEVLEHHAHALAPKPAQLRLRLVRHVLAVHEDSAGGGLQQPIDVAHQGGFAASRQTHDTEDLPFAHGESGVGHSHHAAVALQDLGLGQALRPDRLHRLLRPVAENLPDVLELDGVRSARRHGEVRSGRP